MLSIHSPSIAETSSIASIASIASTEESAELVRQREVVQGEEPNLALAPEEIATLSSLMSRYDLFLVEMDDLNQQLEELLKQESPPRTIES